MLLGFPRIYSAVCCDSASAQQQSPAARSTPLTPNPRPPSFRRSFSADKEHRARSQVSQGTARPAQLSGSSLLHYACTGVSIVVLQYRMAIVLGIVQPVFCFPPTSPPPLHQAEMGSRAKTKSCIAFSDVNSYSKLDLCCRFLNP